MDFPLFLFDYLYGLRNSYINDPKTIHYIGGGTVSGSNKADQIYAINGAYDIDTGRGDDIVATGMDDDIIRTGQGHDIVFSYAGNNLIDAGDGNDKVATGAGDDTIHGGAGDDTVFSGAGADVIDTGAGNDRVEIQSVPGSGEKWVDLGAGDDVAVVRPNSQEMPLGKLFGGEGFDTLVLSLDANQAQDDAFHNKLWRLQRDVPQWATWDPELENRQYYVVGFEALEIEAPVLAFDDVASTDEYTVRDILVLVNDLDLLGNTVGLNHNNVALKITAVDDSGLAAGASVTIEDGRKLRFDPGTAYRELADGETLDVEFGYTVSDDQGFSDTARVTVTVTGTDGKPSLRIVPIVGDESTGGAGYSVASAGDVNGDGRDDMFIGAPSNRDEGGEIAGAAYLVYGRAGTMRAPIDLSDIADDSDRRDGFMIVGETPTADFSSAGRVVSSAGDFNGDGLADMLIGTIRYPAYDDDTSGAVGAAYLVYGQPGKRQGTIDLADIADDASTTDGFKIVGEADFDFAGNDVASAGDVNGDGIDDILVTAYGGGAVYLIYGQQGTDQGTVHLADIADETSTSDGFKILTGGDALYPDQGKSVSSADFNGDGLSDILVRGHVIYGNQGDSQGTISLRDIANDRFTQIGFQIDGATTGGTSAGDINGDGIEDIIFGGPYDDEGGDNAGAAFVVYGVAGRKQKNIDLAELEPSKGFKIVGEVVADYAGYSVSSAGDVNGDGEVDLLIGIDASSSLSPNIAGAAYLVFGTASDPSKIYLADIALGIGGIKFSGEDTGDKYGQSVSAAGDVNQDGYDDILIGAWGVDSNVRNSGEAYLIYGAEDLAMF